ncbi:MAG TPA: TIM barrel protein, partial [Candidatus Brocadiia bacterium]|nr:TIM barrel protein [Candidatus Brocadiia bacterium]
MPAAVISEPAHLYLRLAANWLLHPAAQEALRLADGVEAAGQMRPLAIGDPEPRPGLVERFHAACDRNRIRVVRSMHSVESYNTPARRHGIQLASPAQFHDNLRLLRGQIRLGAALRRPPEGPSLLVLHPGAAWRDDLEASVQNIARLLIAAAPCAVENHVRLALETEPISPWARNVGQSIHDIARAVVLVNEWTSRRGLPPAACLNMDIEHSLISAWGRADAVIEEIKAWGSLIEGLHFVSPKNVFHLIPPTVSRPWDRPAGLLRRRLFKPRTANAHNTIAPPRAHPGLERIMRAALRHTAWRNIGAVNFEALPAGYYAPRPRGRGCSIADMLAGLRHLRRLLAETEAQAP